MPFCIVTRHFCFLIYKISQALFISNLFFLPVWNDFNKTFGCVRFTSIDLYSLDARTNFIFQRIHGVIQSYTPEFFLGHVTGGIKHFGISDKVTCDAAELITYHQGYNEPGYDRNTPQQLGESV